MRLPDKRQRELDRIKLLIEILGLLGVMVLMVYYAYLARLQSTANALTTQSLAITQESLKNAQQANDLTKSGMTAANTPSISIAILDVKKVAQNRIRIDYEMTNHSNLIANYVDVECFLNKQFATPDEPIDPTLNPTDMMGGRLSIMPNSPFYGYQWFVTEDNKASDMAKAVNRGSVDILVLIQYCGPLGNETNFFEIFKKGDSGFGIIDLEPNVDFDSMFKQFLNESLGLKGH